MGYSGRTGARRARRCAAALALVTVAGACAGGDDDSEVATPPLDTQTTAAPGSTTAPACSASRHAVVLDFGGTLTVEDEGTIIQLALQVPPRPGTAELASAYHDRGYEIVYLAAAPTDMPVGDTTLDEALTVWLTSNAFPLGDRARIWTWGNGDDPLIAIVEELLRLGQAEVTVAAAYTDDTEKAHALASGGVASGGLWTLGDAADTPGTTPIPDDDVAAHVTVVERLGMVCQPD